MSAALDHLAARVATDPRFLANSLAEYARSEAIDDDGLAAALGCARAELTHLRLCGTPRPEQFLEDVAEIAVYFGIDPNVLTGVVRRGQGLARVRASQAAEGRPGFLLAARDGDREPPPAPDTTPDPEGVP